MGKTLQPRASVEAVIEDGGAVLLDVREGKYYSLNELGAHVWQEVEALRSRDDIVAALKLRWRNVPTIDADVDRFIDHLRHMQLIEAE